MPFVKATYSLDGDGPLALTCYEAISALNAAARQAYYPNLQAVAHTVSFGDSDAEQELIVYAKSCVQPRIAYYFQQLSSSMKEPLEAFKAARPFSPYKLQGVKPSTGAIDAFVSFPFLSSNISALLREEFPLYIYSCCMRKMSTSLMTCCSSGNSTRMIYLLGVRQQGRYSLLSHLLLLQNKFFLYLEIRLVSISTHLFKTTSRLH